MSQNPSNENAHEHARGSEGRPSDIPEEAVDSESELALSAQVAKQEAEGKDGA